MLGIWIVTYFLFDKYVPCNSYCMHTLKKIQNKHNLRVISYIDQQFSDFFQIITQVALWELFPIAMNKLFGANCSFHVK